MGSAWDYHYDLKEKKQDAIREARMLRFKEGDTVRLSSRVGEIVKIGDDLYVKEAVRGKLTAIWVYAWYDDDPKTSYYYVEKEEEFEQLEVEKDNDGI